jgi:hypothetical protein
LCQSRETVVRSIHGLADPGALPAALAALAVTDRHDEHERSVGGSGHELAALVDLGAQHEARPWPDFDRAEPV